MILPPIRDPLGIVQVRAARLGERAGAAQMKPPKPASEASASTRAWWSCPGVVYFIGAGDPPIAIKIGMAAQTGGMGLPATIVRRLAQIQSSNHELIQLLGVIHFEKGEFPSRDADARERELHIEFQPLQRFKSYRRGAEWFTSSPALLARIREIADEPEKHQLPRTFTAVEE
jgi:hypothetical protein